MLCTHFSKFKIYSSTGAKMLAIVRKNFIKTKLETNAPDKRSEMHLHTHPSTLVA